MEKYQANRQETIAFFLQAVTLNKRNIRAIILTH